MGRIAFLALLFGAIVGCNDKGKEVSPSDAGTIPGTSPGFTSPLYSGVWDAMGMPSSGCVSSPAITSPGGSSELGGTLRIDDAKVLTVGWTDSWEYSFDGDFVYQSNGYAWTWVQIDVNRVRVTYFDTCYMNFKRRGT